MFHNPRQEPEQGIGACDRGVRGGGVLFSSNPRGTTEGGQGERYGDYMEFEVSISYVEQAGFRILDHYYRPEGRESSDQPWVAIVCRRN